MFDECCIITISINIFTKMNFRLEPADVQPVRTFRLKCVKIVVDYLLIAVQRFEPDDE